MLVIPAIDLRGGKCVRMRQGDPRPPTTYETTRSSAPRLRRDGAQRLHVIDLDGAFGSGENLAAVEGICRGRRRAGADRRRMRNLKHAETAFAAGATEIISARCSSKTSGSRATS